jgi:peptidoglycan/xylan/chitin deacetylase (PgdA/CDA1 family)
VRAVDPGSSVSRPRALLLAWAAATAGAVGAFGASLLSIGLPGLLLARFADGVLRPGSSALYPTVRRGARGGRGVALSFDDGPDPEVTPAVLDALGSHGARATFFTIGRALEAHPQIAQRAVAEGHELANHSWSHSRWGSFAMPDRQRIEIERGERAVAAIAGNGAAPLYRAPFGVKSPPFVEAARRKRLTVVAWSLHSRDTFFADPARIAARVLRRIHPGDIVLLHDGHDVPGRHRTACARAVPLILAGLRERGLECVTVSELLGLRASAVSAACSSPESPAAVHLAASGRPGAPASPTSTSTYTPSA